jgi:hypothetical protein
VCVIWIYSFVQAPYFLPSFVDPLSKDEITDYLISLPVDDNAWHTRAPIKAYVRKHSLVKKHSLIVRIFLKHKH